MKIALISTVFNESESVFRWAESFRAQTRQPDEFVIVDGGSSDGTPELIRRAFSHGDFPAPRVIVERCNIARGRNLAVQNTTADILAAIDAGSIPEKPWLEEITRPLREHQDVDVVGGWCPIVARNSFQKRLERYTVAKTELGVGADCNPSARNVAFRRTAWESVGGYPEWLTLTGEDALFNLNLHWLGARFFHQPTAVVNWEARPNLAKYLKMMWQYGYGSGEMNQTSHLYLRWLATTLVPPLILFSRNPIADVPLRYLRNASSALGWISAKLRGHRPPMDWKRLNGVWLSPQTIASSRKQKTTSPLGANPQAPESVP